MGSKYEGAVRMGERWNEGGWWSDRIEFLLMRN